MFRACRSSASPPSWRSRLPPVRRGTPPGGDGSRARPAASPSTTGSPTRSGCRGSSAGRRDASRRSSSPPTSAPTSRSPPPPRAASRGGSASAACGCSPPYGPPSRWPEATFSRGSPGCSSGTPSRGARRCARRRTWRAFTGSPSSSPSRASPSTSRGSGCPTGFPRKRRSRWFPGSPGSCSLSCTAGPFRRAPRPRFPR